METDRGKGGADALDRSIQVPEHFRADDSGYFRTETGEHFIFMYDQHFAGLFHGGEDGFRIERDQRADVDDFHVPVMLFLQLLGDTEAEMRGIAIRDHAQVTTRPADTGFPERNLEVFRHKTGCFDRVILCFRFEKDSKAFRT